MLAGEREFLFSKMPRCTLGPTASYPVCARVIFCRYSGHGVKLSTHLHPVPWVRMNGTTPLLSPYAFLAWTETTVPLLI